MQNINCPVCNHLIPLPLEGDDIFCDRCYAIYRRVVCTPWVILKSGRRYICVIFGGRRVVFPSSPNHEFRDYERARIKTLNNLARVCVGLTTKDGQYAPIAKCVFNLWRETNNNRVFDSSALERVEAWIEEV